MSSGVEPAVNQIDMDMETWNPMEEAYSSNTFNRYVAGPGAKLSPKCQDKPYLVFKNMPRKMTINALTNMCLLHGRVTDVRCNKSGEVCFVDLASLADMEAVFRAYEKNEYGFRVFIGKQNDNTKKDDNWDKSDASADKVVEKPQPNENVINMDRRSYMPSEKKQPRPQLQMTPLVNVNEYQVDNSLLQQNDPQRHFLIEDDAHTLERAGAIGTINVDDSDGQHYRNGRAFKAFSKEANGVVVSSEYDAIEKSLKFGSLTSVQLHRCIECMRATVTQCSCCLAFYCGTDCSQKVWRATGHKRLNQYARKNFPRTLHGTPAALTTALTVADMPPVGSQVVITCITKTNLVFIRPHNSAYDHMRFFSTISKIHLGSLTLPLLQMPPKCGQVVIAPFQEQLNRAMVLNADDLECVRVIYIDFGNVDIVPMSALYEPSDELIRLPRLAIPVLLKDVRDAYMFDGVRKFMHSYLRPGKVLQVLYEPDEDQLPDRGVYRVKLIDKQTGLSFNKRIALLTRVVEPKEDFCLRSYLKVQMLTEGDDIELMVMDNSMLKIAFLSCTSTLYACEIARFERELQLYAESLTKSPPYAPRVEELCIVKYDVDNKWYRARCLELVGDGHPTIIFIDYGNVVIVNIKDIRRYPQKFNFPIYTVDCEIVGLPEFCEPKLVERLEELIVNGDTILCGHVELFEEARIQRITLPKIIAQLSAEGLLPNAKTKPSNSTLPSVA